MTDKAQRSTGERLTEDRARRYGHPIDNWSRIGIIMQAILELPEPVPPETVGLLSLAIKLGRLINDPFDQDSLDDIEGYAEAQRMLKRALES
jgi:hypothetical protein